MLTNQTKLLRAALILVIATSARCAFAEAGAEVVQLTPIRAEGSAADLLLDDPVLGAHESRSTRTAGSGSITRSIVDDLPLPVEDPNRQGGLSTFRGLGRSAEDTAVQAFGIPLNSPQGGGFDLSAFPQFLWSGYRFQLGSSGGAYDPQSVAGSLTLIPWTQAALSDPSFSSGGRVEQLVTGDGGFQSSAAVKSGDVALVAGQSAGDARGPSLAMSARLGSESTRVRLHLLATDLEADISGTRSHPTRLARQRTARAIPVAQLETRSGEALYRGSVYYDATYLRFENPDPDPLYAARSRDQVRQFGTEQALVYGDWKLGGSVRRVSYQTLFYTPPIETLGSLQLSRAIEAGEFLIEPRIQAVGVSGYGMFPVGSLGVRKSLGQELAVYSRASYSRRFPSLADRFYSTSFFVGNPDLRPERDATWIIGAEGHWNGLKASIEALGQRRWDVQIPDFSGLIGTVRNQGLADVGSITPSVGFDRLPWGLRVSSALSLNDSRVSATGNSFAYLPTAIHVLSIVAEPENQIWNGGAFLRSATRRPLGAGSHLPGYSILDLQAGLRLLAPWSKSGHLQLVARLEDVGNRKVEFIQDYPTPGRVLSASVTGEF